MGARNSAATPDKSSFFNIYICLFRIDEEAHMRAKLRAAGKQHLARFSMSLSLLQKFLGPSSLVS
jgi:hypothetical protein